MITKKCLFIVYFCFWVILFSYAQNTISCDIDSLDLEEAYLDSAFTADEAGDYLSAIEYAEKCLMVSRDTARIIDDSPMFSEYKFLVEFYAKAGMWGKALRMQKRRTDYWKNMFQCSADNEYAYFMMFRRWAQLLSLSGANKSAIREVHQFIDETNISKMYLDGITEDLADYYFNINDYQNALKYYEKSGSKYGVAKSLAALGDYLKAIGFLKKQIENDKGGYITISLDVEQRNGPYDTWLCDLASYYNQLGQYDNALVYEGKHRKMSRFESAKSYYNQGVAYVGKMQLDSAICYLLKAEEIYRIQHQSKQHAFVLAKLLSCYLHTGEYDKIEYYIDELIKSASNDLLSSFSDLTYNERSKYIELYSRLLGEQIPMYMYYVPTDKLEALAYDALLLIRGALLNSENNLRRVINERHDASLNKIWEELKANRYILSKQLEKDSLVRKTNVDSLQKVIYSLEDSLIIKCKAYGDITKNMKLKWQDIQKCLSSSDVAIEFLSFPIENDSVMYAALTLRKDDRSPKLVPLFEEKQLKNISDSLCYQSKDMTQLVWEPLFQELQGVKNIYFSPSGALYNIGIEYLPGMEDYNIYRLSSTRELVTGGKTETKNRAVLYGGLRYDAGFDKSVTEKSLAMLDEVFKERANVRGMGLRGGKEYLKHTKEEVDIIGEELNKANWKCVLDSAAMGTEESFKALSGRKIGCLHISTHGFYYNKEEADNARYKFMLIDNCMVSAEDKALTRSGLVMSGANHILEDEKLPDNVEDGILTAKEIADVDLRGLDLVVLSACQTGLGDIAQGEGVFGLQRGFKKAGANSILMSLWEVDDKATQILMTQFYRNLLSGQSKRQSLLNAQKNLREYRNANGEQCYNSPKYWAAFILLDGFDKKLEDN